MGRRCCPFARLLFSALGAASLASASSGCWRGNGREVDALAEAIRARLAASPPALPRNSALEDGLWEATRQFYRLRNQRPAWIADARLGPAVDAVRQLVARAPEDGLVPEDYPVPIDGPRAKPRFSLGRPRRPAAELADLEVRTTAVLLRFARDLAAGRVRPDAVDRHWFGRRPDDDVTAVLAGAIDSGKVEEAVAGLRPSHPQYAALSSALADHRSVAARGGWAPLPAKASPGAPLETALRARLSATGDAAIRNFEQRHGLEPDGRVDAKVVAALDTPVETRIRQIELNLERWRWLPKELGARHIVVNIPTFRLVAYSGGRPELGMSVITGADDNPTPIFSDEMTTVVFSPYWNIPPAIAREEILPAAAADPGYLARQGIEIRQEGGTFRLRQRPGAKNALGRVKFMFPNRFNVYLHDTPADSLFARVQRALSHGCVRVEKPFDLASWVLRDSAGWDAERIQEAMLAGREQHVKLDVPISVHILYQTVWVAEDGTVEFRDDLYGHDAHQQALAASPQ